MTPHSLLDRVAESVLVSVPELKQYVTQELDEFLAASTHEEMDAEFQDVLFALQCLAWAHSGRHLELRLDAVEHKVRQRLRTHATIRRAQAEYADDRIPQLEIGVLHIAFGRFGGQWQRFDALQNGTIAEISLLTDVGVGDQRQLRNHCIVTFADTSQIEYDILHSSADTRGGNTIRCQIPRFLFARAKKENAWDRFSSELSLQVMAALDGLHLADDAVVHYHSWEGGFLSDSDEFRKRVQGFRACFSPYLTTGRLAAAVATNGGSGWTLSAEALAVAAEHERRLAAMATHVILESAMDHEYYRQFVPAERIRVRTFARVRSASYESAPLHPRALRFLAGGRPVREKGFVELCREFAHVRDWANASGVSVQLEILCREQDESKGAAYIAELRETIASLQLHDVVTLQHKVSMERLMESIRGVDALIVPSLYDPYCLMTTYAVEQQRPAFTSRLAGVSENVRSEEFLFSPDRDGDLADAIRRWHMTPTPFQFESRYPSYDDVYRF